MLSQVSAILCAPSGKPGKDDCLNIAIILADRDHRSYRESPRSTPGKYAKHTSRKSRSNPVEIRKSEPAVFASAAAHNRRPRSSSEGRTAEYRLRMGGSSIINPNILGIVTPGNPLHRKDPQKPQSDSPISGRRLSPTE